PPASAVPSSLTPDRHPLRPILKGTSRNDDCRSHWPGSNPKHAYHRLHKAGAARWIAQLGSRGRGPGRGGRGAPAAASHALHRRALLRRSRGRRRSRARRAGGRRLGRSGGGLSRSRQQAAFCPAQAEAVCRAGDAATTMEHPCGPEPAPVSAEAVWTVGGVSRRGQDSIRVNC
ncbi:unnamed protein product, partial [Prorocentrum cordatum]